jgi:hypothetical protein
MLIKYFPTITRAYEIALLGNFTIQVVFDNDYIQGFSDYETIKSFFTGVDFVKKGDLIVQLYKPDYKKQTEAADTIDNINKRVEIARKNKKPTEFKDASCEGLLKTSLEKLDLSLNRYTNAIEVSKVIAQLNGSKTINVEHISEAIIYNLAYSYDSKICNAENKTINFGKGIEISLHHLSHIDIDNAIKYLSELVK